MTPIYRSPDQDQTQAMQSLLFEHQIQTSIIETKKTNNASSSQNVIWYELWLRNLNELARAKSIITQHEFTKYRTSMSSYRTSVVEQKKRSESFDQAISPSSLKTNAPVSLHEKTADSNVAKIPSPVVAQPSTTNSDYTNPYLGTPNPFLAKISRDTVNNPTGNAPSMQAQPRENLIPINNKRVFKRLGLLLGFSEEQIAKADNNNKLYRPWDAGELNESVKKLKQKTS